MDVQTSAKNFESKKATTEIFGSFFLGDSEFALSVNYVQEVVVPPTTYSHLPLAPAYLQGLFNLRGHIIPVVDLKILFKITNQPNPADQRIAIVEVSGYRIGLLFDKTGEIFRSHPEERNDFNEETQDNLISGVFKKDDGRRILQILNIPGLINLKSIPKQNQGAENNQSKQLAKRRGQRKNCISFVVGPSKCALGISEIQEILKVDQINRTILSANHCIGNINVRGATVPVIDFAAHLGFREADKSGLLTLSSSRIIVMKFDNEFFGLLVDSVDSIVSYFSDELVAFPAIENKRAEMFIGCILGKNSHDTLLLKSSHIFNGVELKSLTQGHSTLYSASQQNKRKLSAGKKTYISFRIENNYAVGIDEVREIIDCPEKLLQPPGLPPSFKGILNIRNELVNIVDARMMYNLEERKDSTFGKVLIFRKDKMHFGLIVDSVESIISFSESEKMKVPEILYKNESCGLGDDVTEAVLLKAADQTETTLFIINMDSIFARLQKTSAA